jgi:hypothetical protein
MPQNIFSYRFTPKQNFWNTFGTISDFEGFFRKSMDVSFETFWDSAQTEK